MGASDGSNLSRRDFLATASGAALAAALPQSALPLPAGVALPLPAGGVLPQAGGRRRRYAIVGTGGRGTTMWGSSVLERHGDAVELVGLCDANPLRVAVARARLGGTAPVFTDFGKMCAEVRPDLVTVTTVDGFHADYIVQALDRGIDVITEKPMVIDENQCRAVLDAERRNGRRIIVGFNYRYAAKHTLIKEILMGGAIGKVSSVDFAWYLDVHHGADYFRRWHRLRSKSGSLLVHKATHHFDLVNWWLDAAPVEVGAFGSLRHYGRNGKFRHTHCRTCPHQGECAYFWDMTKDAWSMELYASCESADGYLRDGCVFREDIDIFDTMDLVVRYQQGITMSYSLNACMPFEGYRIAFNGEKGRLEVRDHERQPWTPEAATEIFLTRNFGQREAIPVPVPSGGHGGGDDVLRDLVFAPKEVPAHLALPDSRQGAWSCLTGIAARHSIDRGRFIRIDELVPGL